MYMHVLIHAWYTCECACVHVLNLFCTIAYTSRQGLLSCSNEANTITVIPLPTIKYWKMLMHSVNFTLCSVQYSSQSACTDSAAKYQAKKKQAYLLCTFTTPLSIYYVILAYTIVKALCRIICAPQATLSARVLGGPECTCLWQLSNSTHIWGFRCYKW